MSRCDPTRILVGASRHPTSENSNMPAPEGVGQVQKVKVGVKQDQAR